MRKHRRWWESALRSSSSSRSWSRACSASFREARSRWSRPTNKLGKAKRGPLAKRRVKKRMPKPSICMCMLRARWSSLGCMRCRKARGSKTPSMLRAGTPTMRPSHRSTLHVPCRMAKRSRFRLPRRSKTPMRPHRPTEARGQRPETRRCRTDRLSGER